MDQKYGLLIDNYWCTGCHTCEIACRNEHNLPIGQYGIKMLVNGPWELMEEGKWEHTYYPVITEYCDFCADRLARGEVPSCQFHCLASVIEYGPLDELAKKMGELGRRATILVPYLRGRPAPASPIGNPLRLPAARPGPGRGRVPAGPAGSRNRAIKKRKASPCALDQQRLLRPRPVPNAA